VVPSKNDSKQPDESEVRKDPGNDGVQAADVFKLREMPGATGWAPVGRLGLTRELLALYF
jgi:hypothetical protein